MKAAYQGVPGAFGHEACRKFLPEAQPVARATFADVIKAVENGEAELGILPVDNNAAGPTGAQALIDASDLVIVAEHGLDVRMHLLGVPGARLGEVRTVVSHPIALRQCAGRLAALGLLTEEAENTALAAQQLDHPARAVLASEAAAEAYGLAILLRDMHDRADNETRFAVVARSPASPSRRPGGGGRKRLAR